MDEQFTSELSKHFGSRIQSLLFYGSNAFNGRDVSELSDYDFCLVLDTRDHRDLEQIAQITEHFKGIDLSIHYVDELEDFGWNRFQHGGHGAFFLLHLASAKTLLGSNIFARKISVPDDEEIQESLRRQVVEYFWRLDHWVLEGHDVEFLKRQFKKYLVRIAQDLLVMKNDISFGEINTLDSYDFVLNHIIDKPFLSAETRMAFKDMVLQNKSSTSHMLQLKEHLYDDFRSIAKT